MGKYFVKEAVSVSRIIEAAKTVNWREAGKDLIGPGIAIGAGVGLVIGAANGGLKDKKGNLSPKGIAKNVALGMGTDAATVAGIAVYQRYKELKPILKVV